MVIASLVIIDNLNIRGAAYAARPFKANPPLIIDANAESTKAIALQSFEPVAPQHPQLIQVPSRVKDFKTPVSLPREALKLADKTALGKNVSPFVPIAQDHDSYLTLWTRYVNRQYRAETAPTSQGGAQGKSDHSIGKPA
jgi:hypothetical protein